MASVDDFIIDFNKEEESGGGGIKIKEGTYRVKIIAAKHTVSAEKGTHGLEIMLQIMEGKYKGKKLRDTLWARPKAYSRFRLLLEAIGKKVPAKIKIGVIAKAVKGSTLYVEVEDEKAREGYSTRSRVTFQGFISEDDYNPDDEDEDDDDLEEEDEDEEEEDEDELEDEDEEDEEEEEPEPPKKKRAKKTKKAAPAAAKKRSKRKAKDEDEDEEDDEDLEDLDLDDL